MTRWRCKTAFLALAALLIAGQAGAVLHAFEHDIGGVPGKVCSTCITAAHLGAAAVDHAVTESLAPARDFCAPATMSGFRPRSLFVPCQRGPPAPL